MNDFVGCLNTHLGETRYYLPDGIYMDGNFKPHSDYLGADFSKYIVMPDGIWTLGHSLALWGYDENNTNTTLKALLSAMVTKTNLDKAVPIIEQYFGETQLLETSFKFQLPNNYCYCFGSKYDDSLIGSNKNDTLWGNSGNDILNAGKGNDKLLGGNGNDEYVFKTGDGNDIIQDTDENLTSVKDIVYKVKDGRVNINSNILTGGSYNETTGQYDSNDTGVSYTWSGLNGTDLLISYGSGDTVTVKDFNNGDLGILFDKSKTDNLEDIANLLKRDKQVQADILSNDENYATKEVSLTYVDEAGIEHTVIDCEKTSKILNGYGDSISGASLDATGTFMVLASTNNKITLKQKPVDYSPLVNEMKNITNGIESKREDLPIQGSNIYIPTSSKDGSPTIENIHYIYATKPSGGGFLAGLFTVIQLAATLATGNFLAAAFVALNSGIAGNKVAQISTILDNAYTAFRYMTPDFKGLSAIFTNKSHGVITGAANGVDNIRVPSLWINEDYSYILDGIKYNKDGVKIVTRQVNPIKNILGYFGHYGNSNSQMFKLYASKWGNLLDNPSLSPNPFGALNLFDLIVNKNTNPNIPYSQNYSVNTSTGSISGCI